MHFRRFVLAFSLLFSATDARAVILTVTTTATSGDGSLAKAITDANATVTADTIVFDIPGSGVKTIAGPLPAITQPVTIDAYSQGVAAVNSIISGGTDATPLIRLDASPLSSGSALLVIDEGPTVVRGLVVNGMDGGVAGIRVSPGASGVQILGCFIGTTPDGQVGLSDGTGILVEGSAQVGGVAPAERNLIAGNDAAGIDVRGASSTIVNNLVGVQANGVSANGNGVGIALGAAAQGNVVGGTAKGSLNLIAHNDSTGIELSEDAGDGNTILGNSIFDNGGLGIDLGDDGVTPNDEGDDDDGPNRLQNAFVVTFARVNGSSLRVEGLLQANQGNYRVEVFRNEAADDSGAGEGEELLMSTTTTVGADEVRYLSLTIDLDGAPLAPFFVTATATNTGLGDTSEFSNALETVTGGNELVVTNTLDGGNGSLQNAIQTANATEGPQTIVFAIPGAGPHEIPFNGNTLSDRVILDGYSQPGATPNTLPHGTNADLRVVLDGSGAQGDGLQITGDDCVVRGLVFRDFPGNAMRLASGADGTRIEGSFLGTDVEGLVAAPNGDSGVLPQSGATNTTIGGEFVHQRNLISGNQGGGIGNAGAGTVMLNNIIGADATGDGPLGNDVAGIIVTGPGAVIGNEDGGAGNVIRHNAGPGILVDNDGSASILGNSISGNEGLGIDLFPGTTAGVTPNDLDDVDQGPNDLQNFPVLTDVANVNDGLDVFGSLDVPATASSDPYTIGVFESDACDPSGNGEGERFLGSATVFLSAGDEDFVFTLPSGATPGAFVSAVATDEAFGHTSEFSACIEVPGGAPLCGDASGDDDVSAGDALTALKTAVGSDDCPDCVCDVNGVTGVSSSDALLILKAGVGQNIDLNCPPCN